MTKEALQRSQLGRLGEAMLEDLDGLVDTVLVHSAELPGYDTLPRELLRPATEMAVQMIVRQSLCGEDITDSSDRSDATFTGRLQLGIPIESIVRGLHLAYSDGRDEAVAAATRLGLGPEVIVAALSALTASEHSVVERAVIAGRAFTSSQSRADVQRRTLLVHRLLSGETDDPRVSLAEGLRVDHAYVPIHARSMTSLEPDELERLLVVDAESRGHMALVALIGSEVVGVFDEVPNIDHHGIVIGVGPRATIPALRHAYEEAVEAADAAVALGLSGVVELDDLGVLPVVIEHRRVGDRLVRQYIEPVLALGAGGSSLIETVKTYLDHDQRALRVARLLHIHRNTLQYRLRRYSELTGADLSRTQDTIEVWWALTYHAAKSQTAAT